MTVCVKCGIPIKNGKLCQTCRKYQRNGGVWHPLPPYGAVVYDEAGRPICHVCGMALDKLIEHTKRKHGLNTETYRAEFGLMRKKARLTSPKYADKMRGYTEEYKTHKKNFYDVQHGIAPRGVRHGHQSQQEIEQRRPEQVEKGKKSRTKETPEQRARNIVIWTKNLPNKKRGENNEHG